MSQADNKHITDFEVREMIDLLDHIDPRPALSTYEGSLDRRTDLIRRAVGTYSQAAAEREAFEKMWPLLARIAE